VNDAALLALAARQHGVVSDAQARVLGYSERTIRRRVASSEWQRPLPRVLRCTGAPKTARQDAMAAVLWAGPESCASHTTAGTLWSLDGIRAGRIEVTVAGGRGLRSPRVAVHRSLTLAPSDRRQIDQITVTSPTRTLLDLARSLSMGALELAMEDAFRSGLSSPGRLESCFSKVEAERRAGAPRLRTLLETRSGGAGTGSGGEVRLEGLLRRHGLPRPVRQHPVTNGGRTIYVDLAYPELRLAIEFDSLRWHTGRTKLDNDAERRNLLRAANWDLLTVTHTMIRRRPSDTAALVAAAYSDCCAKTARSWPDSHNSRAGRRRTA
jgi:very-short-patch-repair endonuclease